MAQRRWNFTMENNVAYGMDETSLHTNEKKASPKGFVPDRQEKNLLQNSLASTPKNSRLDTLKLAELKTKKAWVLAKSPFSQIFMTLFMTWMTGSALNIFSIMITLYAMFNPLKAIFSVNSTFSKFDEPNISLLAPKLVYVLIQMAILSIGMYRCYVLGLLPMNDSDWISNLPVKRGVEYSMTFFH